MNANNLLWKIPLTLERVLTKEHYATIQYRLEGMAYETSFMRSQVRIRSFAQPCLEMILFFFHSP